MAPTLTHLLRHLRRLSAPGDVADSDAALLARFARRRDDAAFAALVARHGPMVLGVCRRILGDPHAAEDCFQATFLVLTRKAHSISRPTALAGWLYGVASRVALKARGAVLRARAHQALAIAADATDQHPDPLAAITGRELLAVLEEELAQLPQVYRLPVVLCCLEGKSQEEVARQLGWTPGSVKGRLERGRARLHARLVRKGLTLAAVFGAAEASRGLAAISLGLASSTVNIAISGVAGNVAATAAVPANVAHLAEGVIRAMFFTKLKGATALLLVAVVLGLGIGLLRSMPAATGDDPGNGAGKAEPAPVVQLDRKNQSQPAPDPEPKAKNADPTPADMIRAAITKPGGGESWPILPVPSTTVRGQVANEIIGSKAVRAAYAKLDAARERNVTWFEGVQELEKEKAAWCLASCLCHPSSDVQIHALRALQRVGDKRVVPFVMLYAEYMAILVGGSENATIHGIIHTEAAKTLSSLTGVKVDVRGQDPEGLLRGVQLWRRWQCEQKE